MLRITNGDGLTATILPYGARLQSLLVPDRAGTPVDVVLGFETEAEYRADDSYAGAIVGRIAGRVAGGLVMIDGKAIQLSQNEGSGHLHGGFHGLDKQVWDVIDQTQDSITLRTVSPDGAEGYPGKLTIAAVYELTDDNSLRLTLEATTDKTTPVCLTNHTYFNLRGEGRGDIRNHHAMVFAAASSVVDDALRHTGQRRKITSRMTPAGLMATAPSHGEFYFLSGGIETLRHAAKLVSFLSGISLDVFTNQTCLQVYSGKYLACGPGKFGTNYGPYSGVALECQGWSAAERYGGEPSNLLRPGETYRWVTEWRFGVTRDG